MAMTIVVTRNSPERFRGFLTSCMCEIAPGVYTAPRMTQSVRDRVWSVLEGWFRSEAEHAVLMTWPEPALPGGQDFRFLGIPRQDLCEHDGIFLARRTFDDPEALQENQRADEPGVGTPPDVP
jgi:CRISPR-associated protein Cas2